MVCPKCGNQVNENASFCNRCGYNLKESKEIINNNNINTINNNYNNQVDTTPQKKGNKKKVIIILVIILVIVLLTLLGYFIFNKIRTNILSKYADKSSETTTSYVYDENNHARFVDGNISSKTVKSKEDAISVISKLKDKFGIKNTNDELSFYEKEESEDITYYKYNQVYKGIQVYGMNLIVSANKNGEVLSISGEFVPNINIDINGKKTKDELESVVKEDLGKNAKIISSEKYILADSKNTTLVYIINGYSDTKVLEYIVDANSGKIIDSYELFDTAAYEFNGQSLNGLVTVTIDKNTDTNKTNNKYRLYDPTRNIEIVDAGVAGLDIKGLIITSITSPLSPMVGNIEGNLFIYPGVNADGQEISKIGITALKNYETIYDYYKSIGRKSYDNKGGKIIVNINVKESSFSKNILENSVWSTPNNQMYIGSWKGKSFTIAKDVLAHEFTHGVIAKTARFVSSPKKEDYNKPFETGSINEGIADIIGCLIEDKNWTIGEDIDIFRDLINPESLKNPSSKNGKYYYPYSFIGANGTMESFLKKNNYSTVKDYDKGGVHHNATVVGHAAYLMYKNGAFSSKKELAKVWYNSLFLMGSYANFEDCAHAVIKSAKNLGLSGESIITIYNAFVETKMIENGKYELNGTVKSNQTIIDGAKISIYEKSTNKLIDTVYTNNNGEYSIELPIGVYKVVFEKDGYETYQKNLIMKSYTKLNVNMAFKKAVNSNNNTKANNYSDKCKSGNCHKVVICQNPDIFNISGNTELKCDTTYADDGYTFKETKMAEDLLNSLTGGLVETEFDGKIFRMKTSILTLSFAYYYKGTDEIFDWTKPITEDIEIEFKAVK